MKNKIEAFKDNWFNGIAPSLIRHRLNTLIKDGFKKGDSEEVDVLLDRLSTLRKRLLKFYDLKETDL